MLKYLKKIDVIVNGLIEVISNLDNPKLSDKIVENVELKIKIIDLESEVENGVKKDN